MGGYQAFHPCRTTNDGPQVYWGQGAQVVEIYNNSGSSVTIHISGIANYAVPVSGTFAVANPSGVHRECSERVDTNLTWGMSAGGIGESPKESITETARSVSNMAVASQSLTSVVMQALKHKMDSAGNVPLTKSDMTPTPLLKITDSMSNPSDEVHKTIASHPPTKPLVVARSSIPHKTSMWSKLRGGLSKAASFVESNPELLTFAEDAARAL
jgi:hypothetical protein